jgi:hypothetical protein
MVSRLEVVVNGVGLPPPKEMVPAALENVGSVVQSENTDPVLLTLTTERFSESKAMVASTALTLSPPGTARTVAVNVCPAEKLPLAGETTRSAAYEYAKEAMKKPVITRAFAKN